MYIPNYSDVHDQDILTQFITEFSFGSFVTQSATGSDDLAYPEVNHYPFLLERQNGEIILWTHLAKSNPQWKALLTSPNCLAVFQGPHAYISPAYYVGLLNVPTWNYTAVHAKCTAEVFTDPAELRTLLDKLVTHFETRNGTNWKYELPDEFDSKLISAIVGVKLKVHALEGKFKLSQNRKQEDYSSVLNEFNKRNSENDQAIVRYMELTRAKSKISC